MASLPHVEDKSLFLSVTERMQSHPWMQTFLDNLINDARNFGYAWLFTVSQLDPNEEQFLQYIENIKSKTHDVYDSCLLDIEDYRDRQNAIKPQEVEKNSPESEFKSSIEKLKEEINLLWDKCHCSGSDRNKFPYMYTTEYTKETSEIFEKELQVWKKFYQEYESIIKALDSYYKISLEMDELQLNSDLNTVYKNRGAKLISYVKRFDCLTKSLQKAKNKLLALDKAYRKENKLFKSNGQTIQEIFSRLLKKKRVVQQSLQVDRKKKPHVSTRSVNLPTFKLHEVKNTSNKHWRPSIIHSLLESDSDTDYENFEEEIRTRKIARSSEGHHKLQNTVSRKHCNDSGIQVAEIPTGETNN